MNQVELNQQLFQYAREAGLPVSWWQKAFDEGENREWRELRKFAELIAAHCASICYTSNFEDSDAHAQNILFEFDVDGCSNLK